MKYALTILLFVFIGSLSFGQQLTRLVDYDCKDIPLPEALHDLEVRYAFKFGFDDFQLRQISVSLNVQNKTLDFVLKEALEKTNFTYEESGDLILIYRKEQTSKPTVVATPKRTYTIVGDVRDVASKELLPFVSIYFKGSTIGTTTDVDGHFSITLDTLVTDTMVLQYVGCEPLLIAPNAIRYQVQQSYFLRERSMLANYVIIEARSENSFEARSAPSEWIIDPGDMGITQAGGEADVLRAAQLLPGISATQESSNGLNIRGSSSDQTLLTMDGFTLYHIDHFFGAFSAINMNAVKNMRILKTAGEVGFAGRTGGIVEITGKEGNPDRTSGKIELGALSIGGIIETPLNREGSTTLLLTARRAYTDALFSPTFRTIFNTTYNAAINSSNANNSNPDFHFQDFNAKLSIHPTDRDIVNISFYGGKDQLYIHYADTVNDALQDDIIYTDESTWSNTGAGMRWVRRWRNYFVSTTQLGWSRFNTDYFSMDSIYQFNALESTPFRNEKTNLYDVTAKIKLDYYRGPHTVTFGALANDIRTNRYVGINSIEQLTNEDRGTVGTLFIQDNWRLPGAWRIQPGLQIHYSQALAQGYADYRLTATRVNEDRTWTLKWSAGRVHQFVQRLRVQSLYNNNPDSWRISSKNGLPVLYSDQLVAGVKWHRNTWTVDLEAFSKWNHGTATATGTYGVGINILENGEQNQPEYLTGKSFATGSDLMIMYSQNNWSAWCSYSFLYTQASYDLLDLPQIPEVFEQRHEVKLGSEMELGHWKFNALWVYGSGRPYTPYLGSYDFKLPDGTVRPIPVYGNINSGRLPAYHRLDLSAQYEIKRDKHIWRFQISCFNAYNRINIRDVQYLVRFNSSQQDDYFIEEQKIRMLGILPSAQIQWEF